MAWKELELGEPVPRPEGAQGDLLCDLETLPDGSGVLNIRANRRGLEVLERLRRSMRDRVPDGDLGKVVAELCAWWVDKHRDEIIAKYAERGEPLSEQQKDLLRLAR